MEAVPQAVLPPAREGGNAARRGGNHRARGRGRRAPSSAESCRSSAARMSGAAPWLSCRSAFRKEVPTVLTCVYVRKIIAALFARLGMFAARSGRKARLPTCRPSYFLPRLEALEGRLAPAGVI